MDRKKISILLGFIIVLLFAFSCSLNQEIDAAKNKSNKGTIQDEPTMPDWPEVDYEQIKKLKT